MLVLRVTHRQTGAVSSFHSQFGATELLQHIKVSMAVLLVTRHTSGHLSSQTWAVASSPLPQLTSSALKVCLSLSLSLICWDDLEFIQGPTESLVLATCPA